MITRWMDAGVTFTVELSETGNLVIGQTITGYPFEGGTVAFGWTQYIASPGLATDVNWTVSGGNQSISYALASFKNAAWGIDRTFPAMAGHAFSFTVKCRTMQAKTSCLFYFDAYYSRKGVVSGSYVSQGGSERTQSEWTTYTLAGPVITDATVDGIFIRMRFGSTSGDPVTWGAQWNGFAVQDTDSAPNPITWRDITCDVKSMGIRYGRERFTSRYEVAGCNLTLENNDGQYSYAEHHPFNLRPGRLVRINAYYKNVRYPMYYGAIDTLTDGYSLDGRAISTWQITDPTTVASNVNSPSVPVDYWGKHGARITALLNVIGYQARAVDVGVFRTTDIEASGRTIRDEMGVTADSEGGAIFADREGRIVFKDRTWATVDPKLMNVTAEVTAAMHVGDAMPIVDDIPNLPGAPIVCPHTIVPDWSMARVINKVELANAGKSAHVYNDDASQKAHGVQTYSRLDFVNLEDSALDYRAADLMAGNSDPNLRVNSVTYRPDASTWEWTLSVFLNWLVRVWYLRPTNDWGYAVVTHIQSIEHRITATEWEVSLNVDQPIAFSELEFSSIYGWDFALWDDALWDQKEPAGAVWSHGDLWSAGEKWGP